MIRFEFEGVGRNESGVGYVDSVLGKNVVNVPVEKIMSQFVPDAEALETFVGNVRGVVNSERVAVTEQHA